MSSVLLVYASQSSLKLLALPSQFCFLTYSPEFGMCIRHQHGMFLFCCPTATKAVGWLIDWLITVWSLCLRSYILCKNIRFFHLLVLFIYLVLPILPQSHSLTDMKCFLICKRGLDEIRLYWPRHIPENTDPMKYLRKVKIDKRKEREKW